MKINIIKFFENPDNFHCLQCCVKSTLSCYFLEKGFSDKKIDINTIQKGGWTWMPPAVVWLHELGLDVKLYSTFDYKKFAQGGIACLRELWGEERFSREQNNGAFKNISLVQKKSQEMCKNNLWVNELLTLDKLKLELSDTKTLAIGKTIYEWLDGQDGVSAHYVLVIEEYGTGKWKIYDPGPPGVKNRKVAQSFKGDSIFGDILLIRGFL